MKIDTAGLAFIKQEEGFSAKPVNDNGHLMWGHGHDRRGSEVVPASVTLQQSDDLLVQDLNLYFEPTVNSLAPWANQNQFNALCDFSYNLGVTALATLLHHGQAQAAFQMPAWCYEHVNGVLTKSEALAARRQREVELFNS